MTFKAADLLKCVKREVAFRRNVYPKRIKAGLMTQEEADRQIAMMEEIAQDYEQLCLWEENDARLESEPGIPIL